MSTEKEYAEMVARAAVDPALRQELLKDLVARAREQGVILTDEELATLRSGDWRTLPEGLDQRVSKSVASPTSELLMRIVMHMRAGLGGQPRGDRPERE